MQKDSDIKNIELNLPDDTRFKLLFKTFLETTNTTTQEVISNNVIKYRSEYTNYELYHPLLFAIKYYKFKNVAPETSLLKNLLQAAVDKGKLNVTPAALNSAIDDAISTNITNDKDLIDSEILSLMKSTATRAFVMEHADDIVNSKTSDSFLKEMEKIVNLQLTVENTGMSYFNDLDAHLDIVANPEARLSTGFTKLDSTLNGGFLTNGRCLGVVVAPAHTGKSAMLSNLAYRNLKDNKFVVIISLEMSQDVYAERIDSHISRIGINQLAGNIDMVKKRIEKFYSIRPNAKLVIKEFAAGELSSAKLSEMIVKIEKEHGRKIDILYLDYLTLMRPNASSNNMSMYEKGGEICKELRAITYKHEFPIITAAQAVRSAYNSDNPSMDQVGESISIAQTADWMGMLCCTDEMRKIGSISMTILKNRLGGHIGSVIDYYFDNETLILTESTGAKSEPAGITAVVDKEVEKLSSFETL